ncbi:MAG: class I adenylate-forming enzyme family protein [Planctomycetota bacterium]|jgi:long-chain acyl-CoA synthetase
MGKNTITAKTAAEAIAGLTKPGAEFEVDVKTINGVATRFFKNIPKTLPEYYRIYCDEFAERDFLVWYDDRLTFSQVYKKASVVAHVLKNQFNVKKGDRVAIACRNFPEWVFALMGITSIGAIAVAINSWGQSEELAYGLESSGSRIVFVDQKRANRLGDRIGKLGVQAIVIRPEGEQLAGTMPFEDFMSNAEDTEMPEVKLDADEDIMIMYTSGSSGKPKGSVSSHRNILTALFNWKLAVDIRKLLTPPGPLPPGVPETHAVLCNLPLFHVTGCFAQLLLSLVLGRKVVMMYKWNAEEALRLIEKERITYFTSPSTLDWDLMESPSFKKTDLSSVLIVGGGGSPRPAESVLRIDKGFPNAIPVTGWGMTETNAIGVRTGGKEYVARPDCAGYPEDILDFKIVDKEGNEVPAGEQGEIWVKGASIIRGYWNKPEASAEAITDGWLHTGDVGYFDEDGFLYICDRITDMILRGGENIYCAEIESVLYEHPSVLEATVFGVPDRRLGEVPAAVIVPRENSALTEAEVQDHVRARLAKFKVPEHVWFSKKPLLRDASEKISKRTIRENMIETALG